MLAAACRGLRAGGLAGGLGSLLGGAGCPCLPGGLLPCRDFLGASGLDGLHFGGALGASGFLGAQFLGALLFLSGGCLCGFGFLVLALGLAGGLLLLDYLEVVAFLGFDIR